MGDNRAALNVEKLIGKRFGFLTVVGFGGVRSGRSYIVATCDCGKQVTVESSNVRRGITTACGCRSGKGYTTHGRNRTAEHRVWTGIKTRCHNPKDHSFARYGARGIVMCERWRNDFAAFLSDMGPRPSPAHSIDRYPNQAGNYEPGNCRWATRKEQGRNKRSNRVVEFNGESATVAEWAERTGLKPGTIHGRLKRWSVDKALTQPLPVKAAK